MRKALISLLLIMALPSLAQAQSAKKIQCWTDDKGNRNCGDHVPPEYAKQEREIYNSQGVVVDKKSRQLTSEEIAEQDRKAAEDAAAAKRAQDQAAYDKFLTDSYGSASELESARKLREQMLDGRIDLTKKAVADNEKSLDDLRSRVEAAKKAGKEPDDRLLKQVKKYEDSLADSRNAVVQLQKEKEQTVAKFNQDIERYKQLRPDRP
jgi:hypothetical protein